MSEDKRTIKVKRTASWDYEVKWPDHYPDMSLAETAKFEYELDVENVIESLINSDDAKYTVEVDAN